MRRLFQECLAGMDGNRTHLGRLCTAPQTVLKTARGTSPRTSPGRSDERRQLFLEDALERRPVADLPLDRLASFEDDDGRDAHDPELLLGFGVGVDVHLQ